MSLDKYVYPDQSNQLQKNSQEFFIIDSDNQCAELQTNINSIKTSQRIPLSSIMDTERIRIGWGKSNIEKEIQKVKSDIKNVKTSCDILQKLIGDLVKKEADLQVQRYKKSRKDKKHYQNQQLK